MSGSRPGIVAREAYRAMVALARADGQIAGEERGILERYARALRLSAEQTRQIEQSDPETGEPEGIPLAERVHVLRMMYRVAWADGTCGDRERDMLREVARALRLSRVQAADVEVAIERETRQQRKTRRFLVLATAAVVLFAVVSIVVVTTRQGAEATGADGDVVELRTELDRLTAERAERDAALVRETTEELKRLKTSLLTRIESLETTGSHAELVSLREELDGVLSREVDFKEIERRYRSSVLLVGIRYAMTKDGQREWRSGFGTGFFVSPDGLIVTSKHVVEPWKFSGGAVKMLDEGYVIDESSVIRAVWPAGSEVRFAGSYNTRDGTLRIEAMPPDNMEERIERLPGGGGYVGRFHVQDNADLALLQAALGRPARALPLLTDLTQIEKLDPVMVLGFPTGMLILEQGLAETSPSLGEVRKVEETVYVTSPIVPGNSGGPVLDRKGRVIGIATRSALGEATMGNCIQSRHVLPLLPPAKKLRKRAERLASAGDAEAARQLFALVELLEASGDGAGS